MSTTIGVITNNRHHVFQRQVITGIEHVMREHGYAVLVDSIAENPSAPQPVSLPVAELAGVMVIANVTSDDYLMSIAASGKPLTLISHRIENSPIPAVIPDNLEGIARMVDYIVDRCQRRRIVFIQGDLSQNDGRQRTHAFRQRLKRHDLALPEAFFLRGDFSPEVAAKSLRQFLETHQDNFDAVAAADYIMGVAALDVLREAGLAVPEQVCAVAFGDGEEAQRAGLTTISVDVVGLGQRAARQLLGQINGLAIQGETIVGTAIIRRMTG